MFTQKNDDDFRVFCKVSNFKRNFDYDNCYKVKNNLFIQMEYSDNCYYLFTKFDDGNCDTKTLVKCEDFLTFKYAISFYYEEKVYYTSTFLKDKKIVINY